MSQQPLQIVAATKSVPGCTSSQEQHSAASSVSSIMTVKVSMKKKIIWLVQQSILLPLFSAFLSLVFVGIKLLLVSILPVPTSKPLWFGCKADDAFCWMLFRSAGVLLYELLTNIIGNHVALFIFLRLTMPDEMKDNNDRGRRRRRMVVVTIAVTAAVRGLYMVWRCFSVDVAVSGVSEFLYVLQFCAVLYHRTCGTFVRRILTIPLPFLIVLIFPHVMMALRMSMKNSASGSDTQVLSVCAVLIPALYTGISWLVQASVYELAKREGGRNMDESALLAVTQFAFQMMQVVFSISYARMPLIVVALATSSTSMGFLLTFAYRRHSPMIWKNLARVSLSEPEIESLAAVPTSIPKIAIPGAVQPLPSTATNGRIVYPTYPTIASVNNCTNPADNERKHSKPKTETEKKIAFGEKDQTMAIAASAKVNSEVGSFRSHYYWHHRKALVLLICIFFGIGATAVIASACRFIWIYLSDQGSCSDGQGVFKLELTIYPYLVVVGVVWWFVLVLELLSKGEMLTYWYVHWRSVLQPVVVQYLTWGPYFVNTLHWIMVVTEWSVCWIKEDGEELQST